MITRDASNQKYAGSVSSRRSGRVSVFRDICEQTFPGGSVETRMIDETESDISKNFASSSLLFSSRSMVKRNTSWGIICIICYDP